MLIIDNNVFIHIVKTGGTSFKDSAYENRVEDIKFYWQHAPAKMIPIEFKDYNKYAVVRHPYDWYKSYYDYIVYKQTGELLAERLAFKDGLTKKSGYVSFEIFLRRALDIQTFVEETNFLVDFKTNMKKCGRLFFSALWGDLTKNTKYKTLYQFHFFSAIDNNVKIFKIEEDMSKLFSIFKLKEYHSNVSPGLKKISNHAKKIIYKNDKIFFDKYNYRKEYGS